MALTKNRAVLAWIDEMAAMTQPDQLVWIDGSEAQLEELRKQACASGEIERLNEEKLPGCYLHRTAVNDVARVEDRTFICCKKQEDAGPTNHWMDPQEMYAKLKKLYTGAMKGRTMYVIPYSMGVVGSPFAKYGIELTDSIYVVLNMAIMTRVGRAVADVMGDDFVKGLHAKADIDPENRYIVHFPEDNTIMSVNSGYGGNVLLGKKCFALRIASDLGRQQGWMAEHMLILGVENPQGGALSCRRLPLRLRQDQPGHAHSPGALPEGGLEGLVRGGRYRLAAYWRGRPAVGHEPGVRLLRRGPRHQCQI